MPYPELMVRPMREQLTLLGVKELTDAGEVEQFLSDNRGTALLVINSVCGCAAGSARPAVALALQSADRPDHCATVFAGQDTQATAAARDHFPQVPPSSPAFIVMRDGQLVDHLSRQRIEGRNAREIADDLIDLFRQAASPS
jgi:putative YphP/YqiW family bacilliredoxin